MSVSSALQALQQDITNARTAITNKGGTVTSGGGSSQLATDIATIPAGPAAYIPQQIVNGKIDKGPFGGLFGATDVAAFGLYFAYWGCNSTSVDLSSLTKITGRCACYSAFSNTQVASVNLDNLTEINAFQACYNMFQYASWLRSISLPSLVKIKGNQAMTGMFEHCDRLTSVTLGSSAQQIDFGDDTSQFQYLFNLCSQDITLNIATTTATLSTLSGYPNFGCTGTLTINCLFD